MKCSIIIYDILFPRICCGRTGENMKNKNELSEFFESSFAGDYINFNDFIVRRSVTGISAACELLGERAEKRGSKTEKELIGNIMTMCCNLMRTAGVGALLAGSQSAEEEYTVFRTKMFLEELARGCESAMNGKCSVETDAVSDIIIRTNKELLRYFLLSFIRRTVPLIADKKPGFTLGCEEKDGNARIFIGFEGEISAGGGDTLGGGEIFEAYPRQTDERFAELLGAELQYTENGLYIALPLPGGDSPPVVEAPLVESDLGFFSACNIMLKDLAE